jgi:hypothetical protein
VSTHTRRSHVVAPPMVLVNEGGNDSDQAIW